jgi:ribosomal protein S18 acetylase RimI-like enzyme
MKLKIEKLKKNHINAVCDILRRNLSDYKPQKKMLNRLFTNYKKDRNSFSVVALLNKTIVGYGSIIIHSTIRGGTLSYIEDIVVEKKFRNLGYGSKIIKCLKKISKEKKCYKTILQATNKNIDFYKKNAFKKKSISMVNFLN